MAKSVTLLDRVITPETVLEIIRKASAMKWGSHLIRWRYFDVSHEGVERMKVQELERLVRKYYGYVADLEGSGVEVFDLLFVRDKIQRILDETTPENQLSASLYERIHDLDGLLWQERDTFLMVLGVKELQHARQHQRSPRSHWWWYLDDLKILPQTIREQRDRLAKEFNPASG